MRRRQFITALGVAMLASPAVARAQQKVPVIGYLGYASSIPNRPYTAAFIGGLAEQGFAEERNYVIDYRWAEGDAERLPALAGELVRDQAAVIFASGGTPTVRAAMKATTSIPIVFSIGDDPVRVGLVNSINRPGGNVTGATINFNVLGAKRWELLREMMPKAVVAAIFVDPEGPSSALEGKLIEEAARANGASAVILNAHDGIDAAFAKTVNEHANALLITAAPFLTQNRERIVALAAQYAIPAIYFEREFAVIGGLMSYGAPLRDNYHQAGLYVGQLLKGAKPSDLPIVQSSKIELVINLKTAKALGLAVPSSLIIAADEVIE